MLSRVADSIFWIARSMERAENLARLLQANHQLMLDAGAGQQEEAGFWKPILRTTGDEEAFLAAGHSVTAEEVGAFFSEDRNNPNSIVNCIRSARENARMVRDQISDELWQCLNQLYHQITSPGARALRQSDPNEYYDQVMRESYLFQGIARSTMVRSEGWLFLQMGTYLERGDQTSRLVDACSDVPPVLPPQPKANPLRWASLLHSCSAYHAFHEGSNHLDPPRIIAFLFLSDEFPRSVRYAVREVDRALRTLTARRPELSSEPVRVVGRLRADLDYGTVEEIFSEGLHLYIDRLQQNLNRVGQAIFETFVFYADLLPIDAPPDTTILPAEAWHAGQPDPASQQQQQQ